MYLSVTEDVLLACKLPKDRVCTKAWFIKNHKEWRLMLGWRLTERYCYLRNGKQYHWLWRVVRVLRIATTGCRNGWQDTVGVCSLPSDVRVCTLFPGGMRKAETQETLLSPRCAANQTFLAVSLPSSGSSGALQVHLMALFLSPSNTFP